jgi:hypothetical protein
LNNLAYSTYNIFILIIPISKFLHKTAHAKNNPIKNDYLSYFQTQQQKKNTNNSLLVVAQNGRRHNFPQSHKEERDN